MPSAPKRALGAARLVREIHRITRAAGASTSVSVDLTGPTDTGRTSRRRHQRRACDDVATAPAVQQPAGCFTHLFGVTDVSHQ
jgi:hypothetical protein